MRYSAFIPAVSLAVAIGVVGGVALAQDSDDRRGRGWWHGPWQMGDDDWGMGRRMMGPGMMGMMGSRTMMPMMFVMMDTDGDGAVSFEEMQAVHKRMFDLVDESEDGKITVEEMRAFMGCPQDDDD